MPGLEVARKAWLWVSRLGDIGASASVEAALGSGIVLASCAASNPVGSAEVTIAYDDGLTNAPAGSPQLGELLRHYAARPPWKVAGVDYAVGVHSGVRLKDPLTLSVAGTAIDPGNHLIRIQKDNVTLDGYDFSLHGGYGIYIHSGVSDTVVSNSKFVVGVNNVVPINAEAGAGSLTITYSWFDGGSTTANGNSDTVWALINFNGSGKFVAIYNLLIDAPSDAIDFSNGTISPTVKYNLVVSMGHAVGSHPDFVQFVGSRADNSVIAFNTIYQPPDDGEVNGMQGIQVAAQEGAHSSSIINTVVEKNTIIAPGPKISMSCSVAIGVSTGNVLDGVAVRDNYLDFRGAYYPFYPPSGRHVVFSGNIDMRTGRQVATPLPRR